MPLIKMLLSFAVVECGSAALVFISGATVGQAAQSGLTPTQMAGGMAAILGSVTVAVMVRTKPAKARRLF
jgi:hypothetical protein